MTDRRISEHIFAHGAVGDGKNTERRQRRESWPTERESERNERVTEAGRMR